MIIDKTIHDHVLKTQGLDLKIGSTMLEDSPKKRQLQKLIWDYMIFIKDTLHPKHQTGDFINMICLYKGFVENSIVYYENKYVKAETRKSLSLSKNSQKSLNMFLDSLKEYHHEKSPNGYFDYWDSINGGIINSNSQGLLDT